MLVDLHAVLRGYPGELPKLAVNDIARGLELLGESDGVVINRDGLVWIDLRASALGRWSGIWRPTSGASGGAGADRLP
jgi:hypothetical protein